MASTPEQKRLARLRRLTDEALQKARRMALRRVKDIEIVEKERQERDGADV